MKLSASRKRIVVICSLLITLFSYNNSYANTVVARAPNQLMRSLQAESCKNIEEAKKEKLKKYFKAMRACQGTKIAHTDKKVVALTFDDGPNEKYTGKILEILKDHNIKATFFMVGKNIEEYPELVEKAYDDGNVIANHSYSHHYLSKMEGQEIEDELTKTSKLIKQATGSNPKLFRPPYGVCSNKSRRVARNLGLKTILWSSTPRDFDIHTTPEKIVTNTVNNIKPGTIILLHDGGGNRAKTVAALPSIISNLKEQGYEFLTVPEMLEMPAYIAPPKRQTTNLMLAAK